MRSVAQPGRALRSGRRGRWFEPSHSDHPSHLRCFGWQATQAERARRRSVTRSVSRSVTECDVLCLSDKKYFFSKSKIYRVTEDLKQRLKQHNAGESFHTSKYVPWELVNYFAFTSKTAAINFEKYLKTGSGQAFANRHFWS